MWHQSKIEGQFETPVWWLSFLNTNLNSDWINCSMTKTRRWCLLHDWVSLWRCSKFRLGSEPTDGASSYRWVRSNEIAGGSHAQNHPRILFQVSPLSLFLSLTCLLFSISSSSGLRHFISQTSFEEWTTWITYCKFSHRLDYWKSASKSAFRGRCQTEDQFKFNCNKLGIFFTVVQDQQQDHRKSASFRLKEASKKEKVSHTFRQTNVEFNWI